MNRVKEQYERKLRQLSKEYEKRGYRVELEAKGWSLPPFLSGFQPDIVAYGPNENVIVEIKVQSELKESPKLRDLAAVVQRQKGWRFELVVLNPEQRLVDNDEAILLSRPEIEERFHTAERLLTARDSEAAFLLAWTAIEAHLRAMTRQSTLDVGSQSGTGQLLKSLFTLGVFSREDYNSLVEALDQRNAIVHGFRSGQVHAWAQRAIRLCEKLLNWKSITESGKGEL